MSLREGTKFGAVPPRHSHRRRHTVISEEDVRNNLMSHSNDKTMQWDFAEEALLRKANAIDLVVAAIGHIILLLFFCFYLFDSNLSHNGPFMTRALLSPFQQASLSFFKNDYRFTKLKSSTEYKDFVLNAVLPIVESPQFFTGSGLPIAAIQFRTQRVKKYSCTLKNNVIPRGVAKDLLDCYGELNSQTEDKGMEYGSQVSLWTYENCSNSGGRTLHGAYRSYDCGGYRFQVPLYTTNLSLAGSAQAYVYKSNKYKRRSLKVVLDDTKQRLENTIYPFIDDRATRFVVTEIAFYNPSVHIFSSVRLYAEVNVARVWRTGYDVKHLHIYSRDEYSLTSLKIVFFIIAFIGLAGFVLRCITFYCNGGSPFLFFISFRNIMNVFIYSLLVCSGVYEAIIAAKSNRMQVHLEELMMSSVFPAEFGAMGRLQDVLRYINGFATIVIFFKCPFYIQSERTTRWLEMLLRSRSRFVGTVLIFCFVLAIFAMTCNTYLQTVNWEFTTVDRSYRNLFYIMLRQINVNALLSGVPEDQHSPTVFLLWAWTLLALYIVLPALIGVMREALAATVEQEPALGDIHYILEYVKATLWHPSHWWRDAARWVKGAGEASRLHQAATKLQQYRSLQYPVVRHVYDTKAHVLTLERLQEALRQPFDGKAVLWLYRHKQRSQSGLSLSFHSPNRMTFTPEEITALWEFLQLEWHLARDSKRAQKVKEEVLWTSQGVQEILDDHVKLLREFPARLAELELGIRDVTARLSVAEMDTATADVHSPGIAGE